MVALFLQCFNVSGEGLPKEERIYLSFKVQQKNPRKDLVISLSVMRSLFTIIRELPERDSWQKKDNNYQMHSIPSA